MSGKKEEWLVFEWPGFHLYQMMAPLKAWAYDFKRYAPGFSKLAVTYERGTTSFCAIRKEYEEGGRLFFEKVRNRPAIMFQVLDKTNRTADALFTLGKPWEDADVSALSNREILARHRRLFALDEALWRAGQVQNLLELHNNYVTSYVRSRIREFFGEKRETEIFTALTAPRYQSLIERQDHDFAKLLAWRGRVKPNSARLAGRIRRHWRSYRFMTYGWTGPALAYEYFAANVHSAGKGRSFIAAVAAKEKERQKNARLQRTLLKNFTPQDRQLALLLLALVDAKAKRVDAHSYTFFIGDALRAEIARRVGLSVNQMRVVLPAETPRLFTRVSADELNREYNFVLYWFEPGKGIKKLVGEAGRKKFTYVRLRLPKIKQTSELTGELAYPGKVRGRVRLILKIEDAPQFQKGEILVTRITDPNYVPIMKKAAAIVTDVGGITCHAAIVSRELRKPCIIGTKVATQLLKTGDRVEVDAEKGVVRKLG